MRLINESCATSLIEFFAQACSEKEIIAKRQRCVAMYSIAAIRSKRGIHLAKVLINCSNNLELGVEAICM